MYIFHDSSFTWFGSYFVVDNKVSKVRLIAV